VGQLRGALGALLHEEAILDFLEVADPAGVVLVELLLALLAGEDGLVDVDDDDEIAAVNVGGVIGLVLAAQELGGGDSGAAQGLARCVENVPFSLDGLLLGHSSGHSVSSSESSAFYMIKILTNPMRTGTIVLFQRAFMLYHRENAMSTVFLMNLIWHRKNSRFLALALSCSLILTRQFFFRRVLCSIFADYFAGVSTTTK